jgi:hypothetical protein
VCCSFLRERIDLFFQLKREDNNVKDHDQTYKAEEGMSTGYPHLDGTPRLYLTQKHSVPHILQFTKNLNTDYAEHHKNCVSKSIRISAGILLCWRSE